MTVKILESKRKKNLLEDFDYENKIRVMKFNERIRWFVENKPTMSQSSKWEAFYDICEDYGHTENFILEAVNRQIRKKGLSVW